MSTTANGYIIDVTDDEGVAIIPAPPSPQDVDHVIASVGSTCPSRDSVSAAIALVRAKQVAKGAILKAEEQILQPRSVSSDQTTTSAATESSMKEKLKSVNEIVESENAVPIISANRDKSLSISKASVKDVAASNPELQQVSSSNTSLPQGPSFEQTQDQTSFAKDASEDIPGPASKDSSEDIPRPATKDSSGDIPSPPSLDAFDGTVDANTIDDVNAFLSKLGVGALHSSSNESSNSIDRFRMLSSYSGASSDGMESPEALAEISAICEASVKKHEEQKALETQSQKSDPPEPSHSMEIDTDSYHNERENPFIGQSFSQESLEDLPAPPSPAVVEDEKKVDESNENHFVDKSIAANVRKVLSTVEEVTSMEADEDNGGDNTNEDGQEDNNIENTSQSSTLLPAASEEHESVYGADGRKEPKGIYEKAKVEVEEIPVSNIGVEQEIKNDMSLMSTDSQKVGTDRDMSIGKNESHKSKVSENLDTHNSACSVGSRGVSDTGSLPWAIRDVASEETMRATGRRRPQFVVSGPRPSNKSRNAVSLFDDESHQASETASELRNDLSADSDDRNGGKGPSKSSDETEIETSDSLDANKSEPETDDHVERGISDGENESGDNDGSEKLDDQVLQKGSSGQMPSLEVGQGESSPTKISGDVATVEEEEEEEETGGENSISSPSEGENQPNSFLRQFEDLDLKDDESEDEDSKDDDLEVDGGPQLDHDTVLKARDASEEENVDAKSPTTLANYFLNIDQRKFETEKEEKLSKDFKRLIMPVINKNVPTIIEEAQIRQAALKANVSLNLVDAFIDSVKDESLKAAPQASTDSECDFVSKAWEDIEDLDEDDAIAAFLSSKIGVQDSEKEEMSKDGDEESAGTKEEFTNVGSCDYEPSETSMIEQKSEIESKFNTSEDSAVETDFSPSRDSTTDFNRSEEETDGDVVECEMNASNDLDESMKSSNETTEEDLIHVPEVVKSSNRDSADPIDMEMLKACESIESYDEDNWKRRTAMATHGWGFEEATWRSPNNTSPKASHLYDTGIHGVTASRNDLSNFMFNKKSCPLARKKCKLSYERRVKPHSGYADVDMYSLQESAAFGEENLYKDETPWELRHVRQRFLHERSLTFSRNWFGDLVKTSGNDKIKAPICKPKSMEMPMRKIPDPGDWTPEWYTTWGGRKLLLRRPSCDSSVDSGGSDSYTEKDYSVRSYSSAGSSYEDDEDEDWEDAPECGTFVNTKQKIGEHVSRVHPDYTSSLRKSRWRKKYFPIGTFPY